MLNLITAAATFVLIHRVISGGPARAPLVRILGERTFRAAFGLLSAAILAWLVLAYAQVHAPRAGAPPWSQEPLVLIAVGLLQLLAFIFVFAGVMAPNPTIAGMGERAGDPGIVRGMLRITRHPFLWGLALFSAAHLAVRHDPASWILFGTVAAVALTGTLSIDAKRRAANGSAWRAFAAATSNLPFAAIVSGRQQLKLGEIGAVRLLAAAALWGGLAWAHPWLSGGASVAPAF